MNIAKFLKRTAAILALLLIVAFIGWSIVVEPIVNYWPDLGWGTLLVPLAMISIIVVAVLLYRWSTDTLIDEFDDESGSLELDEYIRVLEYRLEALRTIKNRKDADVVKPPEDNE